MPAQQVANYESSCGDRESGKPQSLLRYQMGGGGVNNTQSEIIRVPHFYHNEINNGLSETVN